MIEAVEKLANVSSLDRPLQHSMALELVVLEASLVSANAELILPTQHTFPVHHLILEVANVTATIRPLKDTVLVDAVVEQCPSVVASTRPPLCALASCSVVLEDTCDCESRWEPVTTRSNNFTVVPETFELRTVGPVESSMPLQLAVVELALEPRTIRENLLALAFNAVVLKLAFITRSICPSELALALSDPVLPVTNVRDAIRPLHLSTAVHAVSQPLPRVDPSFLSTLEGALSFLHAVLEVARELVVVWPSACALAMEDPFPEASDEFLT
mmetsp:Transcript_34586/g.79080  ORF Transcript_34586/g.79080 Transcript_34586/m.79080 type:complete len:272 (-) Transcript_34586:506-1321(-)